MSSVLKRPIWIATIAVASAAGLMLHWQHAWGRAAAELDVGEFRLRSEEQLSDVQGERLLAEMVHLQEDVTQSLMLCTTHHPMEVNLFATQASYLEYVSQHFSKVADRTAIYVHDDDAGRIMVYRHPGLLDDLRHECTHAVLHHHLQEIPLWLDEGIAEYFEVPREQRLEGNFSLFELQAKIRSGWQPDLKRLESLRDVTELTADDYLECWAWVHLLLNGTESTRQILREYVNEAQSKPPVDRLSDRLRFRLSSPETELKSHLERYEMEMSPFHDTRVR